MYRYLSYISDLANWAKSIAIAAVVTAMDFVSPIDNFLVVILSMAFIDTFWGLAADHGDFRKSKFIRSWVYMLVYFLIIIISFWIGVMMDISEGNAKAFVIGSLLVLTRNLPAGVSDDTLTITDTSVEVDNDILTIK